MKRLNETGGCAKVEKTRDRLAVNGSLIGELLHLQMTVAEQTIVACVRS